MPSKETPVTQQNQRIATAAHAKARPCSTSISINEKIVYGDVISNNHNNVNVTVLVTNVDRRGPKRKKQTACIISCLTSDLTHPIKHNLQQWSIGGMSTRERKSGTTTNKRASWRQRKAVDLAFWLASDSRGAMPSIISSNASDDSCRSVHDANPRPSICTPDHAKPIPPFQHDLPGIS
jgi:hypothetical protein